MDNNNIESAKTLEPIIPGNTYGNIKVLEKVKSPNGKAQLFNCQCTICGDILEKLQPVTIRRGSTKLCSCYTSSRNIEIGKTYGDLEVLKEYERTSNRIYYTCKCTKCGTIIERVGHETIQNGHSNKCDCKSSNNSRDGFGKFIKSVDPNDIIGQKFDRLTVLSYSHASGRSHYYVCKCDCGNTCIKGRWYLLNNKENSCGCHIHDKLTSDIIGNRYGSLLVLSFDHEEQDKTYPNKKAYFFKCKCDCGNEIITTRAKLLNGQSSSCGCMNKKVAKHDELNGFIMSYHAMKQRCNDPNSESYKNYGGRGITYDPKWESFMKFKEDMYESYLEHVAIYGEDNTTIDRIDVDGDYCKENCRWATYQQQANNKTTTHRYNIFGAEYSVRDILNLFAEPGLDYEDIRSKLRNPKYCINDKVINYDLLRNEEYRKDMIKPIHFISNNDQTNISFNNLSNFTINEDGNISQ